MIGFQSMSPNKKYINDPGEEVPEGKILLVPYLRLKEQEHIPDFMDIVRSLKGNIKRDWFSKNFYYCLPLNIGNQYGFTIHSRYDFEATWNGEMDAAGDIELVFGNKDQKQVQTIESHFGHGILTISHAFYFKTPPGVNLMTIQPPNLFIPGVVAMTGVVETDQLRRDFTFNLKLTDPNRTVSFKKGDALAAFIPIPRYYVDSFELAPASDYFSEQVLLNEFEDQAELVRQRNVDDLNKNNGVGRKYFNGEHASGCPYLDHQKKMD